MEFNEKDFRGLSDILNKNTFSKDFEGKIQSLQKELEERSQYYQNKKDDLIKLNKQAYDINNKGLNSLIRNFESTSKYIEDINDGYIKNTKKLMEKYNLSVNKVKKLIESNKTLLSTTHSNIDSLSNVSFDKNNILKTIIHGISYANDSPYHGTSHNANFLGGINKKYTENAFNQNIYSSLQRVLSLKNEKSLSENESELIKEIKEYRRTTNYKTNSLENPIIESLIEKAGYKEIWGNLTENENPLERIARLINKKQDKSEKDIYFIEKIVDRLTGKENAFSYEALHDMLKNSEYGNVFDEKSLKIKNQGSEFNTYKTQDQEGIKNFNSLLNENKSSAFIKSYIENLEKILEVLEINTSKKIEKVEKIIGSAFNGLSISNEYDSQITDIRKNYGQERGSARDIRGYYAGVARNSGETFETTKDLLEANKELGKQIGFNVISNKDFVETYFKLTKVVGLSAESTGNIAKFAKLANLSFRDTEEKILDTTNSINKQYGISLNYKDILEEIGHLSGDILLNFGNSVEALTKAVTTSHMLGTNLETLSKQGDFLLNFQGSLEAQLKAQLLTGRSLNLEKAREAALNNDLLTVGEELIKQGITYAEFHKMNRIERDSYSSALGLSTSELQKQLLQLDLIGKSREEIIRLHGKDVADSIESISNQDRFNKALEKMKDILVSINPLMETMAKVLNFVSNHASIMLGVFGAMQGIKLIKLISELRTILNIEKSIAAVKILGALTSPWSIAALAAGGLALGAYFDSQSGKSESPSVDRPKLAKGGIVTKQLDNATIGEAGPEAVIPLTGNNVLTDIKKGIDALVQKTGKVYMDGRNVGTTQLIGTYNFA